MLGVIFAFLVQSNLSYRSMYPLPGPDLNGLAVQIHFVVPEPGEVNQIEDAGFKWIRMDMLWDNIERHTGSYDFEDYDKLINALAQNHIRPIFTLDSIQDTYGADMGSDKVREAYCRFVAACVKRYAHRGFVWEIWNEPNLDDYWKPRASAEEYAHWAIETAKAIRSVSPDEWIAGPALSHTDWPFLEQIFRAGVLNYLDAVTIHPYRSDPPETTADDWNHLAALIAKYAPAGRKIAMLCGEWGYSDYQTGLATQAQYAARMELADLMCGVDMTVWYDWRDDTGAPEPREQHFGIMHGQPGDKPVEVFLQQLRTELAGYRYERRLSFPGGVYGLMFTNGSAERLVAWTSNEAGAEMKSGFKKAVTLGEVPKGLDGSSNFHLTPTPTIFE